jgi:hypothetical protein
MNYYPESLGTFHRRTLHTLPRYSTGQSPKFTTDFEQLQASAKTQLLAKAYDYAARGARTSRTMTANRGAFDKVKQLSLLQLLK